jgi:hypothetical protein
MHATTQSLGITNTRAPYKLHQQQHGVLVSRGKGIQPQPKAAGTGSGMSLLDSQVGLIGSSECL